MAELDVVRGHLSDEAVAAAMQDLPGGGGAEPDSTPSPVTVGNLLSSSRVIYGDNGLPMDEVPLPGQETAEAEVDADELPVTTVPPVTTPPPQTSEERDALVGRLAVLEAQLADFRMQGQPTGTVDPGTTQDQPLDFTSVVTKVQPRFERLFQEIEGLDANDPQYNATRSSQFARSIVEAVVEDVLSDPNVHTRLRPAVEPVATNAARSVMQAENQVRAAQTQLDALVAQAVAQARAQGYDVHRPDAAEHATSQESQLFWQRAQQVNPNLPGADQIATTLALMPAKAVTPPPPETPRTPPRQPMARQGQGRTGAPPTGEGEGYQPKKLGDMVRDLRRVQVIG